MTTNRRIMKVFRENCRPISLKFGFETNRSCAGEQFHLASIARKTGNIFRTLRINFPKKLLQFRNARVMELLERVSVEDRKK